MELYTVRREDISLLEFEKVHSNGGYRIMDVMGLALRLGATKRIECGFKISKPISNACRGFSPLGFDLVAQFSKAIVASMRA